MLFHTWTFAVFFLIVWLGYLLVRRTPLAMPWLLAASYFFYGAWAPLYLLLVIYSTLIDYTAVWLMARTRFRKTWLTLSLINNLGLLGLFKYSGFLIENINETLRAGGVGYELEDPGFLLPVGISFYTFQSMSYTIDYFRGRIEIEPNLIRFAAYVSLFPQLVAGPIERAESLLPQLRRCPSPKMADVAEGLGLFELGLFKKVALANYLALYVDPIYGNVEAYDGATLALATMAFSWQIYFDFSGYSDMARGVARCFGFRLMVNFRHPYLAVSLSDFWARWHISLSQWFRDYVYIPLGGNRCGSVRVAFNLLVTFLLSGVWHGAAWTFVVWGLWHGFGVVGERWLSRVAFWNRMPKALRSIGIYGFVCVGWVFFRSESMADAMTVFGRIFGAEGIWKMAPVWMLIVLVVVVIYQWLVESRFRYGLQKPLVTIPLAVLMLLYLMTAPGSDAQPFIYFQF